MSGQIQFAPFEGYLYVIFRGNPVLEDAVELLRQTRDAAADGGKKAVLIDIREIEGTLSIMERYSMGSLVADILQGLRVALVGKEPLIDRDRFGENVAINRGAEIRIFTDPDQAVAWLKNPGTVS
jgi:hypothetical protein